MSSFQNHSAFFGDMHWPRAHETAFQAASECRQVQTMFKKISPPVLLLLPAIIVLVAVVLFPLLLSFYSSFTPFRLTRPDTLFVFIGLRNYIRILGDPVFLAAFLRTV